MKTQMLFLMDDVTLSESDQQTVATSGTITQNLIYILDCGSNSFSGGNIKNLVIKNKYLDNEKLRILTI